jgi:hypothetical protein
LIKNIPEAFKPRKAGWDSWLFRIVNTDEVAGSNPALVILFFAFFYFAYFAVMLTHLAFVTLDTNTYV